MVLTKAKHVKGYNLNFLKKKKEKKRSASNIITFNASKSRNVSTE